MLINYIKLYKEKYNYYKYYTPINTFISSDKHRSVHEILRTVGNEGEVNAAHSGNAGDIIYSLPVLKRLHEITAKPLNILMRINEPLALAAGFEHPLGNVMLDEAMAQRLQPLLEAQPYINKAKLIENEKIHLDLTLFRKAGLELDKGNIARWNFYTTGINTDLSKPWLFVNPDQQFAGTIVLARSSRYNNPFIDYSFLSAYQDIVFVGVKSEYLSMKKNIPCLRWQQVDDFLEMAQIIAGSKLFIGNQSFPFSVAEGLKVPRILEVYHRTPNVIPEGSNGYDFYFQKHFEYLVDSLYYKAPDLLPTG